MTLFSIHLSMPKSSASRVLKQMAGEGLLVRNPTTLAYRPSLLLLELAHIVRSSTPLIGMCAQALDTLGTETGHTGYISLLDHNDIVVLRVRPGSQTLRAMTNPGHRLPSWATSTGRALLAPESDAQIRERFPDGLPVAMVSVAPIGGPTTVDELIHALNETRCHRYAVAENEALSGVCSVGCAVADPASGECLSFAGPFLAALLARTTSGISHAGSRLMRN
jgi:DNA-binding IclR family transcriptional regulator